MNATDILQTIQVVTETGFWVDVGIGVGIFAGIVTILAGILTLIQIRKKMNKPE